ncbi:tRNA pseudouridine(13) synthase TruD [Abyssibacter profundi]|uniref:tRNA pseudouridine(13) synthase TruD n=1 Tax=Abyssibacter profundi TaxID=2182787 RepID=A0A363UPK6_9GAMM|nr:tRNA pseudouridine(13) synthase TruD [Abyssibacter profundi]PWN57382.1 tRNA pseudouridine(13) synthase TruD [Abyssibacter profundi]
MIGPDPVWRLTPALGAPLGRGRLRVTPEDFQVDEQLAFTPAGEGEHLMLQVCKRNANTDTVARHLARQAGVRAKNVGYCGMKDRHAVTTQWFSLPWPIKRDLPDPAAWSDPGQGIHIRQLDRHDRKLRRGAHAANRFRLVLRLETPLDPTAVAERLDQMRACGVPNGFGPQRFGWGGSNLERFEAQDRPTGIVLSAARSALFNHVLEQRITDGSWDQLIPGEWVCLSGSRSGFLAESVDETLLARLKAGDLHPSGPMPGRAGDGPAGEALAREQAWLAPASKWLEKLGVCGVDALRRPLRVIPQHLQWEQEDRDSLTLCFELPPGSFATSVVAECIETD